MTVSSTRATPAKFCRFALLLLRKATRVSCIRTHSELLDCKFDTLRLGAFKQSFPLRMTEKQPDRADSKGEKPAAADKKSRLAAALRRNLTKRKDIKEAKNVDKP